ncbi:MAG: peptide chain release factor N(5)-glutamine methyltransferase [Nitrospinaceae bacterium]|jgi:release factor glutamine methyltransferase|nr:MAG: peptide chain release factor N(5)-glutamine methyltransferase [Nitrospinaceae bacterium]
MNGKTAARNAAHETCESFLNGSAERLRLAGVASPRLDAEVLLAQVLGVGREDIHARPGYFLSARQAEAGRALIERRSKREPVSYLVGQKGFWDLDFFVTSHVLIPRPETEILLERFIQTARAAETLAPNVLDVGTGSGNIAVVAAREFPAGRVTAMDRSPAALQVARENVRRHGVGGRVRLIGSDLFSALGESAFDFILSNPPYIASGALAHLMADVKDYEPALALDGGEDGLDIYRRLIPGAWGHLREGGSLILEIGMEQARAVSALIHRHGGYSAARVIKDYSGRERVIQTTKVSHG